MICCYPYKQSFLGERPLARRHSCFYIMNRVPEIYIDLACVICYKFMSTLPFKIIKENTQKLCGIFHKLVWRCLGAYLIMTSSYILFFKKKSILILF